MPKKGEIQHGRRTFGAPAAVGLAVGDGVLTFGPGSNSPAYPFLCLDLYLPALDEMRL